MTDHPITPPPELVEEWRNLPEYVSQLRTMSTVTITTERLQDIATQAARWGADQELEACCEWLKAKEWIHHEFSDELRAARRPKPMSLKKLALLQLDVLNADLFERGLGRDLSQIRRALEQLDD
jgi:hypothetical protein